MQARGIVPLHAKIGAPFPETRFFTFVSGGGSGVFSKARFANVLFKAIASCPPSVYMISAELRPISTRYKIMASTVWRGHLTFGLVSLPVRLYSAARGETVSFNLLQQKIIRASSR